MLIISSISISIIVAVIFVYYYHVYHYYYYYYDDDAYYDYYVAHVVACARVRRSPARPDCGAESYQAVVGVPS